jgi:hypothetical protein
MLSTIKSAHAAAIAILATALLAGCATATPSEPAPSAPSSNVDTSPSAAPDEAFIKKAEAGEVGVAVLEVLDTRTFVVGPDTFSREESGFDGELTVEIGSDAFVVPVTGECGYEESLAFAKQYFAETPEGDAYVRTGHFTSIEYYAASLRAGFAYFAAEDGLLVGAHQDGESKQAGLWATCPGFGA